MIIFIHFKHKYEWNFPFFYHIPINLLLLRVQEERFSKSIYSNDNFSPTSKCNIIIDSLYIVSNFSPIYITIHFTLIFHAIGYMTKLTPMYFICCLLKFMLMGVIDFSNFEPIYLFPFDFFRRRFNTYKPVCITPLASSIRAWALVKECFHASTSLDHCISCSLTFS